MGDAARPVTDRRIDRIDTAPRFSDSDAIRLNNLFRGSDTRDMLRTVRTPHAAAALTRAAMPVGRVH